FENLEILGFRVLDVQDFGIFGRRDFEGRSAIFIINNIVMWNLKLTE
ncbi:3983_t:CDS:1, partial [Ambispora leptoticha]